ncbi:M20 family metallopeptidase [Leucobacter sp. UT-8R-CII-1-4]|uniref:M20 family metallopeptidase n=1 Tax=Leucobacter sp. UT-8R-CII-1-4 TaxID=3040075 RepID=UPI0024A9A306|nr:M20 family metallopeptidase [Leucobacter sp. UT-8R-CII-1-4]MDI6024365.1 M20 family metallopeptidase [Leucobacter sp. UT-8R-CII-1-4]
MDFVRNMLRSAEAAASQYTSDLSALVGIDSGSDDPAGVNRVADWVSDRLVALGFSIERQTAPSDEATGQARYGDALVARRKGSGQSRVLLFAHMDTVFLRGDAAKRPFSIDSDGLAHGPGVTDDKAGIVAGLHAAAHLIAEGSERYSELVLVFTPDEEIGSPFGRTVLASAARDVDVALCLECARENGDLVAARKGVIDLELEIDGIAAHSGIEPERGAHAGLEAAHLTIFLQSIADWPAGITVNVGKLRAGERLNIVPDYARLSVEMRAPRQEDLELLMAKIRERIAKPLVPGTKISILELEDCPPMERTAASESIGAAASKIADSLGFSIRLATTGGVSDANRVSALGVPTLDGLGPIGGGDHTPGEWLQLRTVPQRVAFLATLIDTLGAASPVEADSLEALRTAASA